MKTMMLLVACLLLTSCGFFGGSADSVVDPGAEADGDQQGEAGDGAPPPGEVDDLPEASMAMPVGDMPCSCSSERVVMVAMGSEACYFLTRMGCSSHAECNDGIYCNTEERCGRFADGQTACYTLCCSCSPCTDTPDATCRPGVCSEEQRACAYPLKDSDADGYADRICEGGSDCNDDDPSAYPSAPEKCDGADNDCDGTADEDAWSAAGQAVALTDGAEGIQDADAAPLGGDWIVAWSRGAGAGLRIGAYGADATSPPVPESTPLAGTEGAGEVEVIATGAGEIVLAWIEADRSIKGRKLSLGGVSGACLGGHLRRRASRLDGE